MNFQDELKRRTDEIEEMFRSFLPAEEGFARTMAQAMNYSMLAGGKRLRPMLRHIVYLAAQRKLQSHLWREWR